MNAFSSLMVFVCMAGVARAETRVAGSPAWSADREHRLLIRVDPVPEVTRKADELVASSLINFVEYTSGRRCDLSSLAVVGYDASSGNVIPYQGNIYAATNGDCPFRFYDEATPWQYRDREGYAHTNDGQGTPIRVMEGGARFFNVIGDAKKGRLVWAHMQRQQQPAFYAVYFNALPDDAPPPLPPTGFVGDGGQRCLRESDQFAPVLHGRVAIADLNGDGLFDLLLGNATGTVLWYENMGSPGSPAFPAARLVFADGEPLDVGWSSAPAAVDWDGDGDLDLIVGAEKGCFVHFENVGDARRPVFRRLGLLKTADGNPLRIPNSPCKEDPENKIYPCDYYGVPEFVDWDGDGDLDLLVGGYITGLIFLYENIAEGKNAPPQLVYRGPLQADGQDIDVTWCASPCAFDFDGDGDLDLISGAMQMTAGGGDQSDPDRFLWYYENTGTRTSPRLERRPFPIRGRFSYGSLGTPRAIDFNADGLPDLVVSVEGTLLMLPNIGTRQAPLFDATTKAVRMAWGNAAPGFQQVIDFNGDGWLDLVTNTAVVLNKGSCAPGEFDRVLPLFADGEQILHPTPVGDHWDSRAVADMDADGLLDILVGDHSGHVWFHRNEGTATAPRIDAEGRRLALTTGELVKVGEPPEEGAAPFDVLQGARTVPAAGDFDHDGWMDLVVADTYGLIRVFTRVPGDAMLFFHRPQHGLERRRLGRYPGCVREQSRLRLSQ